MTLQRCGLGAAFAPAARMALASLATRQGLGQVIFEISLLLTIISAVEKTPTQTREIQSKVRSFITIQCIRKTIVLLLILLNKSDIFVINRNVGQKRKYFKNNASLDLGK